MEKGFCMSIPVILEVMLASGTKRMVLEKLKSPELIDRLINSAKNLSYNLIDLD